MKGIILAGGTGSRLAPLTTSINKHLLPVGGAPMIFHPLAQLLENSIQEICVVTSPEHISQLAAVLGSGERFGADFTYKAQEKPGGIAEALGLCRRFSADQAVAVMLGDNVFGSLLPLSLPEGMAARFFLRQVPDPHRFGVAEVDADGRLLGIEEKPAQPRSDLAVTGAYVYSDGIWAAIDSIERSARGELEISDANMVLMERGGIHAVRMDGWWSDAGTRPSYRRANEEISRVIAPSLAHRLNAMCGGDVPVFADEEPVVLEETDWPDEYGPQSALERPVAV
jgi:glucose-1-phosphate thymidylyltransferase